MRRLGRLVEKGGEWNIKKGEREKWEGREEEMELSAVGGDGKEQMLLSAVKEVAG